MSEKSDYQASYRFSEIGLLTVGLMHEIKNPLGFLHSNLETMAKYAQRCAAMFEAYDLLERKLAENPGMEEELQKIRNMRKELRFDVVLQDLREVIENSVYGSNHIRDVIAAVQTVAHGQGAAPARADIEDCLEKALFLASHELDGGVEIERDFHDLPRIECKAGQICQVFLNLVVNAAHAVGEQGRITLRSRVDDEQIIVEVVDNGIGIAREDLDRIFDPFYTTKSQGKGTGLGLALSIEIVQEHGGILEAESTPGEGSVFRVRLPRGSDAIHSTEGGEPCRP